MSGALDEIDALQQREGDDAGLRAPPPDPIVDQYDRRGRMTLHGGAISVEGERNHYQIVAGQFALNVAQLDKLNAFNQRPRRFEIDGIGIDYGQARRGRSS